MRPVRRPSSPRRRRPRDPRIAGAGPAQDAIAAAHHAPTQTPSARALADASARKNAVMTWHRDRPRVIDGATGRPPKTTDRRFFGRGVTVSFRAPEPRTSPVSVHAR